MSDDYLWDGSGEPDPEVERLERLLATLRSDRPAPELPENLGLRKRSVLFRHSIQLAVAAAAVVLVIAGWFLLRRERPSWEVVSLEGTPRIGSESISASGRLAVGQWLETDSSSRARISIGIIGEVHVDPNTRIRLLKAGADDHRLALARGKMHAAIWAPPRLFSVETPSAVAVDLGCTYTLEVDEAGISLLHVTSGWVAFETEGRESFVPAGALCETRPGIGAGTPYREDASEALRSALTRLDFEERSADGRLVALDAVLGQAEKDDAFTLWHLLSRVRAGERSRVFDRLQVLVPAPPGVTREGVARLDKQMLDRWWDELGLEDTTWWRLWKGPAPSPK